MKRNPALLLALLLLKAAVYLPVAGFLLLGWRTCADAVLAGPSMAPVTGRLLYIGRQPRPANQLVERAVKVKYSYRFGARDYTGDAITFCTPLSDASVIDPLPAMHAQLLPLVGKAVTVWVDPARPEHAVLFRYVPRAAMVILGLGLLFVVAFMVKADLYWSRRLRRRFGAHPSSNHPESSS